MKFIQIILIIALLNFLTQQQQPVWDTQNRGSFQVGYETNLALYDSSRTGKLKENLDTRFTLCEEAEGRPISYSIYYPVDQSETQGKSRPKLFPDNVKQIIESKDGFDLPDTVKGAFLDVPISSTSDKYPIVLFSAGFSMIHHVYSSMIEYVASNGYIVVAIDSEYIHYSANPKTNCVQGQASEDEDEYVTNAHNEAIVDLEYFIQHFDKNHQILKKADLENLTAFGQSQGGMIVAAYCSKNTVCKGAVNMDGFDETVTGAWPPSKTLKFLKIAQQIDDYQAAELNFAYNNKLLGETHHRIKVNGTDHMSFSDAYYYTENPTDLDISVAVPEISRYVLKFLEYCLGKTQKFETGTTNLEINYLDYDGILKYLGKEKKNSHLDILGFDLVKCILIIFLGMIL